MATRAAFMPVAIGGWVPPADLGPNARAHWRTQRRLSKATRQLIASLAGGWAPQAQNGPRRRLTITMHRARLMDDDNATALCKAVVDGVRDRGALVDDSPRYAEIVVRQVKATGTAWRGTVLELEELEAA